MRLFSCSLKWTNGFSSLIAANRKRPGRTCDPSQDPAQAARRSSDPGWLWRASRLALARSSESPGSQCGSGRLALRSSLLLKAGGIRPRSGSLAGVEVGQPDPVWGWAPAAPVGLPPAPFALCRAWVEEWGERAGGWPSAPSVSQAASGAVEGALTTLNRSYL